MSLQIKNEVGQSFVRNKQEIDKYVGEVETKWDQELSPYLLDLVDVTRSRQPIFSFDNYSFSLGKGIDVKYTDLYAKWRETISGKDFGFTKNTDPFPKYYQTNFKILNNRKEIFHYATNLAENTKFEDVILGVMAYLYARKNALPLVLGGKTQSEIKKLPTEELERIEEQTKVRFTTTY